MSKNDYTLPPHLTTVQAKIEHDDEVFFIPAYYDIWSKTWRNPVTDNIIQGVKGWKL